MKLDLAVRRTIEYAGKFRSHINKKEIGERLISKDTFSSEEMAAFIEKMNWKDKKNKWYENKMQKAVGLSKEIDKNFKDILFLGVSGSVASGHPKKDDDIDIFIITKLNKLWKMRLILRWWIFKNKIPHRKYSQAEKKDEFCFNLWLDESELEIRKDKQNLKNGIDLILLRPLINKNQTYQKLLKENSWVKKYSFMGYERLIKKFKVKEINGLKKDESKYELITNYLYFLPQYWYMKNKIESEKISLHQAFFHRPMVK